MNTVRAALAVSSLLLLCACSGGESDEVAVPQGFDLPSGVSLTAGGTKLEAGEPASVVYRVGEKATSAITVTVTSVDTGTIDDFRFFSLDDAAKKSTPYYVNLSVTNEGPAGLGGVSVPVYAHADTNTIYPPNELVGDFEPCPVSVLPKSFLPGASEKLCLVYLVPEGAKLETVDLQTGDQADAIHWSP